MATWELAKLLAGQDVTSQFRDVRVRRGKVTSISNYATNGTISVQLGPAGTSVVVPVLASYGPQVNDVVSLIHAGADLVCIGVLSTYSTSSVSRGVWHNVGATGEPAFQNSWVNFGGGPSGNQAARFMLTQGGEVHSEGLVASGVIGSAIYTLPAGYRPLSRQLVVVVAQTTGGNSLNGVSIETNGNVIPETMTPATTNGYMGLNFKFSIL